MSTENHPDFETVLQLYHKRIYNLIYRLLGNFDEAADLTQETFVNAYKAYPRFRGATQAVYPWLCQIAVNSCKNKYKEMDRRGSREAFSLDGHLGEDSDISMEFGDDSANPEGIFERQELESRVLEAMQELPSEFRIVVVLRDMQGLSYKEISDATGLTLDLVKIRLYRGREILRRRLAPYITD